MLSFQPSLFFQHATCPHWIWHDMYSDKHLKGEIPELAQKLLEQGVLHETEYIHGLPVTVIDQELSGQAGYEQTIRLMQQGVPYIYQGVLQATINGIQHRGRPDLLEKRAGNSRFGDYYYAPIDIKSSRDIKREQWLQLTVYSMMLECIQKTFPHDVAIINADKERVEFIIEEQHRQKTTDKIQEITSIMNGAKPPLKLVSSCKNSPWFGQCIAEAEAMDDIALIYKLDARAMAGLRQQGVNTVHQAAVMDVQTLPKIPYVSLTTLTRIQLQAQSLIDQSVKWIGTPSIPNADIKIYFDIEGDPLLRVEYLFGFWVVGDKEGVLKQFGHVRDDTHSENYYIYFLAKNPNQESSMWKEFLAWTNAFMRYNYAVYHFADYERVRTGGLAEKYGGSTALDCFMEQLVDLSKIVQQSVIFPLYFYSIKDIAKSPFLAYKWRHPKAGGAQSIFWYEKWLETGDQQVLTDIVNYNEDDVIATEYLHHWLLQNPK